MQNKLTVYEFGKQLLETNDLDPVYVVLNQAQLEPEILRKWLLTYWCFYHVGTASWITEQDDYWKAMNQAAGSKEWPRSSERRHFRGKQALASVAWLENHGEGALLARFYLARTKKIVLEATEVMKYVQTWRGFGPWISFKVADMLDRLGIVRVRFEVGTAMYEGSPTKATGVLRDWEYPGWEPESQQELSEWAVSRVLEELGTYTAPPRHERPINAQEAETILCKWKSYLGGHYHVGEDVTAVWRGLMRFARCKLSQRLLRAFREGGLVCGT